MTARPHPGRLLGYFEAIAAAAMWGSSGIFAVHLFRMGLPPESLALWRPLVGAAALAAWFLATDRRALRVSRSGLVALSVGGGAIVAVFQIAYQLSIDAVGVPATVALLYLSPAMVAAASGPLLGEWPTRRRVALVALTLAGVWLSALGAEDVPSTFGTTGLAWGVLAAAGYAGYTLLGRWASPRYGSIAVVVYATAGSCALLALAVPAVGGPVVWPDSARVWMLLAVFGVLTISLAQYLFFDALGRIEASRVSVATAVEPVVAALLATVLLSQGLSPLGWIGIALVAAGVVGVGLSEPGARE